MKTFLKDLAERAVRAFAATLLGAITVDQTPLATIHWQAALVASGTAALVSALLSLLSIPVSGRDGASLLPSVSRGRHEAP